MLTDLHASAPALVVESVERATLAAVCPAAMEDLPGWLLGLDSGTVGRAHSAAPLHHNAPDASSLAALEARYAAHQLDVVLRLPQLDSFTPLRQALTQRHYTASQPTLVQTSSAEHMAHVFDGAGVELAPVPDKPWSSVFLGGGFDPVDGAHRIRLLQGALNAVFASVYARGTVVAVGVACFSHGWASVHGMRTVPSHRGQGMAGRILGAFAQEALNRQVSDVFLQVHAANSQARSLYRQAGFATAWTYNYWRQAAR